MYASSIQEHDSLLPVAESINIVKSGSSSQGKGDGATEGALLIDTDGTLLAFVDGLDEGTTEAVGVMVGDAVTQPHLSLAFDWNEAHASWLC